MMDTPSAAAQQIVERTPMSALGQKRTYAVQQAKSALPPIATAKADISVYNLRPLPFPHSARTAFASSANPMSRYKGQLKASRIERKFPHHVDIVVPPGGLGTRLDAMYELHTKHGIKPQRGHGAYNADSAIIRWCFADTSLAAAFASRFKTQSAAPCKPAPSRS